MNRTPSPEKKIPVGPYDGLCIGAGAAGGYQFLGALHYFYTETKWMDNITFYSGTSVGAVLSGLLAIGYTPIEILSYINNNDINYAFQFNVINITKEWGLVDTEIWKIYLQQMISAKWGHVPTLKEIYDKSGKQVCFTTWCLTKYPNAIYITTESHPSMLLNEAMAMSSCIPCIFTKYNYQNNLYVDGALFDSCPSEKSEELMSFGKRLLVIRLEPYSIPNEINSIGEYIKTILAAFDHTQTRNSVFNGDEIILKTEFIGLTLQIEIRKRLEIFKNSFKRIKYQLFLPKVKRE